MTIDWPVFAAVVTAITTVVYTAGTFLLWIVTRRSVKLLSQQLDTQAAVNRSIAFHQVVSSHREVIHTLIELGTLRILHESQTLPTGEDLYKTKYSATLLINHCMTLYIDLESGIMDQEHWTSFMADAREMFSLPLIQQRWAEIGQFYPKQFQDFVQTSLIGRQDAGRGEPVAALNPFRTSPSIFSKEQTDIRTEKS